MDALAQAIGKLERAIAEAEAENRHYKANEAEAAYIQGLRVALAMVKSLYTKGE